jgi:hypothetical protein
MDFLRPWLVLSLVCACDSLAAPPGDAGANQIPRRPVPLPAELVAACPGAEDLVRTGKAECTAIGCQSGYSVEVSPSSGWAAGDYRIELDIDDRAVACEGSIPLKACNVPSFSCDAAGVSLGESGCALPATEQGLASIRFDGFPLALSMRVLRMPEGELANAELTPVYTLGQPNGPGCDPVCCSASDAITLSVGP